MRHPLLRLTATIVASLLAGCSSSASGAPDAGGTHQGDSGGTHPGDSGGTHNGDSSTHQGDSGGTHQGDSGGTHADAGTGPHDGGSGADVASGKDGGSAPDWSCLGSQGSAAGASITYTIRFVDRTTGTGKANLPATLCSTGTLLTDCNAANSDVDAVFGSGTTDSTGSVTFTVNLAAHNLNSDGVTGFVYLVDSSKAIYDQQVFVNFLENQNLVVSTMTPAQATTIASALSETLDMVNGGILGGVVLDCNYKPSAGATVTDDQSDTFAYFASGVASSSATATDTTGEYIVLNAQFASTGLQWSNAAAAAVGGITVAPTSGMVTTVAIPHTD
jgi:hypothetical protein